MSDSRSRNWFLISSIICNVTGERKFSQQKDLSFPLRFASFQASNALSSAMWSLHRMEKIASCFSFPTSNHCKQTRIPFQEDKKEQEGFSINTNLQESPAKDLFAASASSFLFIGRTNGSRCARAEAIVNAGLRHWKIEPMRSIFPIFGSKGRVHRWRPVKQINWG